MVYGLWDGLYYGVVPGNELGRVSILWSGESIPMLLLGRGP